MNVTNIRWALVYPYNGIHQVIDTYEHLALEMLAVMLREQNHEAMLFDAFSMERNNDSLLTEIYTYHPDIIGFSVDYSTISEALRMARELKYALPTTLVCLGGHHVSFEPEIILRDCPQVDFILRGEADLNILLLTDAVRGVCQFNSVPSLTYRDCDSIRSNALRNFPIDLDALPFPDRDLLDIRQANGAYPIARLITSRGCHGNCSFCSTPALRRLMEEETRLPLWRGMSAHHIVEQMQELYDRYKVRLFYFHDDDFIGPGRMGKRRAAEFAAELIKSGIQCRYKIQTHATAFTASSYDIELLRLLRQAGLERIFVGFESGSNSILKDVFNKFASVEDNLECASLLMQEHIPLQIGFIMFHPYTTFVEIKTNIDFLEKVRETGLWSNLCAPFEAFPGMELTRRLQSDGLYPEDRAYCSDNQWQFAIPNVEGLYQHWRRIERQRLRLDNIVYELKYTVPWWEREVEEFGNITLKEKALYSFRSTVASCHQLHEEIMLLGVQYAKDSLNEYVHRGISNQLEHISKLFINNCSRLEQHGVELFTALRYLHTEFAVSMEQQRVGVHLPQTADLRIKDIQKQNSK